MKIVSMVCDIVIALVSCFAILQYVLNKRNQLKSAATIVYNQLKDFDEYIEIVTGRFNEEGNISDYHLSLMNAAFESNAWVSNKHILIKKLSQDDIELINKAYSVMESIEDARKRVMNTFMTTNDAKSYALQFQAIHMIDEQINIDDIRKLYKSFNDLSISFSSKIPHDIFKNMVSNYERFSGTITLEKLRKLSYKNRE